MDDSTVAMPRATVAGWGRVEIAYTISTCKGAQTLRGIHFAHLQACHHIDNNANDFVLYHQLFICWEVGAHSYASQAHEEANDLERDMHIVPPSVALPCDRSERSYHNASWNQKAPCQT